MAELGFRPLGYGSGGILDQSNLGAVSTAEEDPYGQLYSDLDSLLKSGISKEDLREYIRINKQSLDAMAQENPARARYYEGAKIWSEFKDESLPAFEEPFTDSIDQEDWRQAREEVAGSRRLTDRDMAGYNTLNRSGESPISMLDRMGGMLDNPLTFAPTGGSVTGQDLRRLQSLTDPVARNELTAAPPGERIFREVDETVTPYLQAGGYVDHGTVAGELGRRGRLPVREAGETMFERRKRLEGYAHGGYAENKTRSEEEQRLKEEQGTGTNLAERHEAPNWYELMGKRPTLGPRRRA